MQARLALQHGRHVFLMRSLLQHDWARGYAERPGVTVVDNAEPCLRRAAAPGGRVGRVRQNSCGPDRPWRRLSSSVSRTATTSSRSSRPAGVSAPSAGRRSSPDFRLCFQCNAARNEFRRRLADVVVPIALAVKREQLAHELWHYKYDVDPSVRARLTQRLGAVLWRFLGEHEKHIAEAVDVPEFEHRHHGPWDARARGRAPARAHRRHDRRPD